MRAVFSPYLCCALLAVGVFIILRTVLYGQGGQPDDDVLQMKIRSEEKVMRVWTQDTINRFTNIRLNDINSMWWTTLTVVPRDTEEFESMDPSDKTLFYTAPSFHFSARDDLIEDGDDDVPVIKICIKLANLPLFDQGGQSLRQNFNNLLKSVVNYSQSGIVHFIFITDTKSMAEIAYNLAVRMPPFRSYFLSELSGRTTERFRVDFVDANDIIAYIWPRSRGMRRYFYPVKDLSVNITYGYNKQLSISFGDKYAEPIYYFMPFLHELFPNVDRMIWMDADAMFLDDPIKLYNQFNLLAIPNEDGSYPVLAVAPDLSTYYHNRLYLYRSMNKGSTAGTYRDPRQRGVNVGVMLLDLERMRQSQLYSYYLTDTTIDRLANTYHMNYSALGEQDWLTLVRIDEPRLVAPLSCRFNRQLALEMETSPWYEEFEENHSCWDTPYIVVHGNSGSNI